MSMNIKISIYLVILALAEANKSDYNVQIPASGTVKLKCKLRNKSNRPSTNFATQRTSNQPSSSNTLPPPVRPSLVPPPVRASSVPPPAPAPAPPPPPAEQGQFPGIADQDFARDCLTRHNQLRASDREAAPLVPLVWTFELADAAQKYADVLRNRGRNLAPSSKLVHSEQKYGENLAWQRGGDKSCSFSVQAWYDEKSMYIAGTRIPNNSGRFTFKDYGHYTQLVWKSTNSVGCAYADDGNERYVVCEYLPHGNIVGQAAF